MRRPGRLSPSVIIRWGLGVAIVVGVAVGVYATLSEGQLTGSQWRDLLIFGIAQGSVYALIALGYTLVYGVLLMINFAHGDVFMFGAMTAFFVAEALASDGFLNANPFLGILILLLVSAVSSMLVALLLERIAYRPLRRAPRLVPLITAIGASLFIAEQRPRPVRRAGQGAIRGSTILQGTIDILGIPIAKTAGPGHRLGDRDHGRPVLLREPDAHRTGDARGERGQGHGGADGHQRRSHDLDDVRHRRRAGRRRRHPLRLRLQPGRLGTWGSCPASRPSPRRSSAESATSSARCSAACRWASSSRSRPNLLLGGTDVPSPNQLRDVIAFSVLVLVLIFRPYGILGKPEGK